MNPAEIIKSDEVLQQALGLPSSGDFKIGLKVTLFNWRMRQLRRLHGLSQKQLSELVGCAVGTISQIETFKCFPSRNLANKIASKLGCNVEEIFPEWLRYYVLDKSTREFVSSGEELQQALEKASRRKALVLSGVKGIVDVVDEAESAAVREHFISDLAKAMATLKPREQKVLILRFGLNGRRPMTLAEIAKIYGFAPETVRRIEWMALRKLSSKMFNFYRFYLDV